MQKDSSSIFSPVQQLRPRATAREGTKFNPHIIHVNTNFPESHCEFDIEKVDRFEKAGWVVQGYHIRKDLGASDKGQWQANMVSYRNCDNKAVLIKGKTRKSCFDEVATYHHAGTLPYVMEKHTRTKANKANDPERKICYWLLVFPDSVVLDNSILSGNNKRLTMNTTGTNEVKGTTNFITPFVYWNIAERNDNYYKEEVGDDDFALPTV